MAKTTVEIDERLLREAREITHLKTKKAIIERGIRELLRMNTQKILKQELGSFEIELSLDELNKRRSEE
ncbi:MAG: type II toxin-antitoxin system VapB family antitoxin [Deltaproteobacteria bacterium]|nr:type II toxin-antitoxin system VapB family antitoxin [Deltaproteobacteria bacterium]